MRQLCSKLMAGGLSAGVILLWWPMFFPTDSVTTWLCRGVAWTLCFELLLLALSPFEEELWSTHRGQKLSRRARAASARLHHEHPRRRRGRLGVLAGMALALPLALIALGVSSHIPHSVAAPKITQVTRVVKVVKPVRVERVVKIRTVAKPVPAAVLYGSPSRPTQVNTSPRVKHSQPKSTPRHSARTSPEPKAGTPVKQTTPSTPTSGGPQPQTGSAQPAPAQPNATTAPAT